MIWMAVETGGVASRWSRSVWTSTTRTRRRVRVRRAESTERRDKLERNTKYWRGLLEEAGFDVKPGDSPIVPVMLYNARLAQDTARDLYAEGIYVVGFSFPVVPKGQARIRTQLSAAHEKEHLDQAIEAFIEVGRRYEILGLGKKEIIDRYGL